MMTWSVTMHVLEHERSVRKRHLASVAVRGTRSIRRTRLARLDFYTTCTMLGSWSAAVTIP
eukprot:1335731-Rhodomonas_salina.1